MNAAYATRPPCDTRPDQAARVAEYLELNPASTAKEIDAACDVGSVTKVMSDMLRMNYGLRKGWRYVTCASGNRTRKVRTYALTHRPTAHPDLFEDQLSRSALKILEQQGNCPHV